MKFVKKILNIIYRKRNPVNWQGLRHTTPFEPHFGYDRGTPIDRYYIEQFLDAHKSYIQGTVLEVGDDVYTRKFGQQVAKSEILHYDTTNTKASVVGDLTLVDTLPAQLADCFICTQTLNFIFDVDRAVAGIKHLLKQEGTALVTLAGLCQISKYDYDQWGDYWRFTAQSARKIFEKHFDADSIQVTVYGNALAATCLIQGIVVEDITAKELDIQDEVYQVVISVIAINKHDQK